MERPEGWKLRGGGGGWVVVVLGWAEKNKEQQHLHGERDVSEAAAKGDIQYLKGWRLRQPLQHKLI